MSVLLCVLLQEEFRSDLEQAINNLRALKSYSFRVSHKMDTNMPLGNRDVKADGQYVDSKGFYLKGGSIEMFRRDGKTAFEDMNGDWRLVGDKKGSRGQRDENEFLAAQAREPHNEASNFHQDIAELVIEDNLQDIGGVDCVVFSGKLTDDAARKFTAWADSYGGATRGAKRTGSLKVWIDDAYTIRRYELTTRIDQSGFIQAFVEVVSDTELSDLDATTLEPPEKGLALIDGKP